MHNNKIPDNPTDQQWIWNLVLSLAQFGRAGMPPEDLRMTILMITREDSRKHTHSCTRATICDYFSRINQKGGYQWIIDAAGAMFDVMVEDKMFVKCTELYQRLNGPYYVMTHEADTILNAYYKSLGLDENGDLPK